MVARQKELNFKPGEEHSYTNTGYFLLGEVVQRVSGMRLRDFVAQNIFKPLEMNDSRIHDDVSLIMKNRAWGYNGEHCSARMAPAVAGIRSTPLAPTRFGTSGLGF
jgi:CubicO group peptidase (beta-lactamase class C family)